MEIVEGTLHDSTEKIDVRQSFHECVLIEHAHRVINVDDIGIFILHGNLPKLNDRKGAGQRVD